MASLKSLKNLSDEDKKVMEGIQTQKEKAISLKIPETIVHIYFDNLEYISKGFIDHSDKWNAEFYKEKREVKLPPIVNDITINKEDWKEGWRSGKEETVNMKINGTSYIFNYKYSYASDLDGQHTSGHLKLSKDQIVVLDLWLSDGKFGGANSIYGFIDNGWFKDFQEFDEWLSTKKEELEKERDRKQFEETKGKFGIK